MPNLFKKRQSKGSKPNKKCTKIENNSSEDMKTSMKATQDGKASPEEIRSSMEDAAEEVKTYTVTDILELVRSTDETDFTTPELRELILDMKAWMERAKVEVERKHKSQEERSGEAGMRVEPLQRGHLLVFAEIGSIIYRLENRLKEREKFGGIWRVKGKRWGRKVRALFGRLGRRVEGARARLGCKKGYGN